MWLNRPHITNDDTLQLLAHKIQRDVLRTDRNHKFFSGDTNKNVKSLFNILFTFTLTHSKIPYAQGMTDLLSPILYVLGDEAEAYVCFCSIMKRLKHNFTVDSNSIHIKIKLLALLLKEYDAPLWDHLENVGAGRLGTRLCAKQHSEFNFSYSPMFDSIVPYAKHLLIYVRLIEKNIY
jgi:hypothetical protein